MHAINRALIFIEEHLAEEIRVPEIARASGISRFHLSRVFSHSTGYSPARYVRLRRLTQAAQRLARGEQDILRVALDVGFDSHASFSRAFAGEFGVSPSQYRGGGVHIDLLHPIVWSSRMNITVSTPHLREGLNLCLSGVRRRIERDADAASGVPAMTRALMERVPAIPDLVDTGLYQLVHDVTETAEGYAYSFFMGMAVERPQTVPPGLEPLEVCWERYLAFPFALEIGRMKDLVLAIMTDYLPHSEYQVQSGDHLQWFQHDADWTPPPPDWVPDPNMKAKGEVRVPIQRP